MVPDARDVRLDDATRAAFEGSAADLVERYIHAPILQAESVNDGLIGTYAGPRDKGTGYVLALHNAGRAHGVQGAWGFVRGGMGAISRAIAASATAAGAEIVTGAPVERIADGGGRATGVVLADGSEIAAAARAVERATRARRSAVSATASPNSTRSRERLKDWCIEGVSLKLNLALGELPDFTARPGTNPQPHHRATIHIAPSIDYLQRAHDEARAGGVIERTAHRVLHADADRAGHSCRPASTCCRSSRSTSRTTAATGRGPTPNARRPPTRSSPSLARVAPNLPNAIEARQILAPPDLETQIGLTYGHIFHGELLTEQIWRGRFPARTPLPGLYLCGSGAHPGGCVSGIPGLHAANAALDDARVPVGAA